MKAHTSQFPVEKMAAVLEVSTSGYYAWRNRQISGVKAGPDLLDEAIRASYVASHRTYGSPRIAADLAKQSIRTSPATVARRMIRLGISARRKVGYIHTTQADPDAVPPPNLLDRDFEAERVNAKWVSDLTYFDIQGQWHYLTAVIDLADRSVVGWTISANMTTECTTQAALRRAVDKRDPPPGMIFHSDRGSQYTSTLFTEELELIGAQQSMSRRGNCWDNAVAESFFKTLKSECIDRHTFTSYEQAQRIIFRYVEGWYNTCRIHTSLGNLTPSEMYELKIQSAAAA